MENTRIEELDSDFGAVVEILYDPGWLLIPLNKKEHGVIPSGKCFYCIWSLETGTFGIPL